MQRRDVRIALGVVASLLVVFAIALVWRLGFGGKQAEDAVAAAPDAPDKQAAKAKAGAGKTGEPAAESPTVLTATKSSTANPPAGKDQGEPSSDGLSWQGNSAGPDPTQQPAVPEAEPPAAEDPWATEGGPATAAYGASDDSPYGYGDEPSPHAEHTEAEVAQQAAPVEAEPESAAAPSSRGTRNQLREAAAAPGVNPLRGGNRAASAGDPGASARVAADSQIDQFSPEPNLGDQPAEGASPLGAQGWSYAPEPAERESPPAEATSSLAAADMQRGQSSPVTAAAATAAAARGSTPRLLSQAPGTKQQVAGAGNAAHTDDIVTASAEAERSDATGAAPVPAGAYRVVARDTYWRISRRVYGDPAYYRALYEHNRERYPRADRLDPDTLLETPDLATLERLYPQYCPTNGPQ